MMKALLVVSVACLFALTAVRAQTYPAEYDRLDIDAFLSNEDRVNMFGACLLDDTVCSERALKLKGNFYILIYWYRAFLLSFPREWQFYHTESLHHPTHAVTATMLRKRIKSALRFS